MKMRKFSRCCSVHPHNLAAVLSSQGKNDKAEEMYRQALMLKETMLGKKHPSTLTSMGNLAEVLSRQGKYEEAVEMHGRALTLAERLFAGQGASW